MILIDKLAYSSEIRGESPSLKTFLAISSLLVCVSASSYVVAAVVLLVMGTLTVKYANVTFKYYMKMMSLPLAFLIMGTLAILFEWSPKPMDFINIPIGSNYIAASYITFGKAFKLMIVAEASVSCLYFLSLTTPMTDLIYVMKKCKFPWLFLELCMMIYRFIFVLLDIADNINTSQKSRLSNISMKRQISASGQLLSVLLIIAMHKGNLLYDSMEARCYDGEIRVLFQSKKATGRQKILVFGFVLFIIIIGIASSYCGGF